MFCSVLTYIELCRFKLEELSGDSSWKIRHSIDFLFKSCTIHGVQSPLKYWRPLIKKMGWAVQELSRRDCPSYQYPSHHLLRVQRTYGAPMHPHTSLPVTNPSQIPYHRTDLRTSACLTGTPHPLSKFHPGKASHLCPLVLSCRLHHHSSHAITWMC